MPKYLVLYRSDADPEEMMRNADPEQMKAGMDAWMQWAGKAGGAIVDMGTPLAKGQTVGGGSATNAAGYGILQADSREEVMRLLDGHPHLMMPGNTIEVHECLPMPGM
jgi:hypothetical protein